MFVHLSHVLDPKHGAFPGEATLTIEQDRVVSTEPDGCPFNAVIMHLPNHFGTHMDGPHHFNTTGADFDELPIEYFYYFGEEIVVVDLPEKCQPDAIITKADVEKFADQIKGKRLLLLRTGFGKYKFSDPELFENHNPSLHWDLTKWLNEEFPELCCIGMDFLSIGSTHTDLGPEAHRWLLGNYTDHVIVAIEDMILDVLEDREIKLITMGPLRTKGVDSCQVNIMAQLAD